MRTTIFICKAAATSRYWAFEDTYSDVTYKVFLQFAELTHKFAWSEFEQAMRQARRAKTREEVRSESNSPSGHCY
ncbi:MAG: hypothetical protein ACXV8O_08790 [Methylobacter sp.]